MYDVALLIVYMAGCTQLSANLSCISEKDRTRFEHIPLLGNFLGSRQHTKQNFGLFQPRNQLYSAYVLDVRGGSVMASHRKFYVFC
jgi:hypothetical protein